jgi:hypothetical protein
MHIPTPFQQLEEKGKLARFLFWLWYQNEEVRDEIYRCSHKAIQAR